jgi:hypothetical protein
MMHVTRTLNQNACQPVAAGALRKDGHHSAARRKELRLFDGTAPFGDRRRTFKVDFPMN